MKHRFPTVGALIVGAQFLIAGSSLNAMEAFSAGSSCYMGECFEQIVERVIGETPSSMEVLVKTRNFESARPKVTIGLPIYSTFKVSCRPNRGYIETEQRIRLAQPNRQPNHATEPGDKLWRAVCNRAR